MVSNKLLPSSETTSKVSQLKVTLVALGVLLLTICIVLSPLAVIWSLNTLFHLAIVYSFKTWLATFVLMTIVGAYPKVSNKS